MTTQHITKEHIDYLHEFCKKKDIRYVDLRIELVDHLCELVQEQWTKTPELNFYQAFDNVYKGFGIFGLMEIANAHENAMSKRYWQEVGLFFKRWITPPRFFLTTTVAALVFLLLDNVAQARAPLAIATLLVYLCSAVYNALQFFRNRKILKEENMLMGGFRRYVFLFVYFIWIFILQPITLHGNVTIINVPWLLTTLFMICILFARANYLLLEKSKSQLEELKLKLA